MNVIITAAVTAIIVSAICCNISATIVFNIIDKHVKGMISMAKESIRNAYSGK